MLGWRSCSFVCKAAECRGGRFAIRKIRALQSLVQLQCLSQWISPQGLILPSAQFWLNTFTYTNPPSPPAATVKCEHLCGQCIVPGGADLTQVWSSAGTKCPVPGSAAPGRRLWSAASDIPLSDPDSGRKHKGGRSRWATVLVGL